MAVWDKDAQVIIPDLVGEGGAHIPLMGFGVFLIVENGYPGVADRKSTRLNSSHHA